MIHSKAMNRWTLALCAALACSAVQALPSKPAKLSFTEAQVVQGRAEYGKYCAVCHGANLEGGAGVALVGATFARTWGGGHHGLHDFYDVIAKQMPKNAPGSLSDDENLAIAAYILSMNAYSTGAVGLSFGSLDVDLGTPEGASEGATTSASRTGASPQTAGSAATYPQRATKILEASGSRPTDDDLLHIHDSDWLTFNRTLAGDRFSPLHQIDVRNANKLQVNCVLQLGELGSFRSSPVVFEGLLYLTTTHKVTAVDGSNCATVWSYTYVPVDPEHLHGNLGVALYQGKVFRGTTDGHLLALDAKTGQVLWDIRVGDGAKGYEIAGAPVAFEGKVFTADSGTDVGITGHVYAFDVNTGALIWDFSVVAEGDDPEADSWGNGTLHGGGATWSSMSIDPLRNLLFVPTGSSPATFNDKQRPGADVYTDSVVALSIPTGRLAWYVQQVPHDVHGWDTAAAPALFEQAGRPYMAVASENGLMYIYDRDSHQTLSQTQFTSRENIDTPVKLDAPVHVCPGSLGQYNGVAYSPSLKMLFLGAADRCGALQLGDPYYVGGNVYLNGVFKTNPRDQQSGWLKGFDAGSGRQIWSVHVKDPILAAVTPTAGNILLTGNSGGDFTVYNAKTGNLEYRFATGGPVAAGISTYTVAGKQYIAVPSGNSSRDSASASGSATLEVFSLP